MDIYAEEHAKALSCHERALFYATKLPADFQIWGFPPPEEEAEISCDKKQYRWRTSIRVRLGKSFLRLASKILGVDFVPDQVQSPAEVEKKKQEQEIKQNHPPHENIELFCLYIRLIYLQAYDILTHRLAEVTRKYEPIRKKLERSGIGGDRNFEVVIASKERVMLRHQSLLTLADPKNWPGEVSVESMSQNWKGLNKICCLYMDEISYLNDRINDYNNILIARRSVKWSLWGLAFSIILAAVANSKGVWWAKDTAVQEALSNSLILIDDMNKRLLSLERLQAKDIKH